jgi:hypothetical protein
MATSQLKSLVLTVPGTPFFSSYSGITTPGVEQTLIVYTVPPATTRNLHHLALRCNMSGRWSLFVGASLVATGRTNAAAPESDFFWTPAYSALASDVVTLKFTAQVGLPAVDLEAFLQTADIT